MGARRHTKAQVQPAKEGVLDSEYGDTARREFGRRRFQRIPARRALRGRRLEIGPGWHECQSLRMLRRGLSNRSDCRILAAGLAARAIRCRSCRSAWHRHVHGAAAGVLSCRAHGKQTGRHGHRGPKNHNRQHQQRAFSAPVHRVKVPSLNSEHPLPCFLRQ